MDDYYFDMSQTPDVQTSIAIALNKCCFGSDYINVGLHHPGTEVDAHIPAGPFDDKNAVSARYHCAPRATRVTPIVVVITPLRPEKRPALGDWWSTPR